MAETSARRFVTVIGADGPRQMHCRIAGSGPPLLALHASPLCSRSLSALAEALSGCATVIAVDTPGYGFSDPLDSPPRHIGDYALPLQALLDALELKSVGLYGTATGAQIAIEFAKRCPQRVDYLIADNAASFSDAERERIMSGYFPELTPRADGGHLLQAWQMMREVFRFFPWHDTREASRVGAEPGAPALAHAATAACLRAGADYQRAYRCAFDNERAEQLEPLRCPTRIVLSEGSILRRYSERLAERDWPGPIRMLRCAGAPAARFAAIADAVAELSAGAPDAVLASVERPAAAASSAAGTAEHRPVSAYVSVAGACYRLRCAGDPSRSPALLLHDAGSDSGVWRQRLSALASRHWVVAVDLPGHGLSDGATHWDADSRAAPLAWLLGLLEALGLQRCAIAGWGLGAELAAQCAEAALGATLDAGLAGTDAPPALPELERWPNLSPTASGAHWIEAWHMLRERHLRVPGSSALPAPAALTRELLALFDAGDAARAARRWLQTPKVA